MSFESGRKPGGRLPRPATDPLDAKAHLPGGPQSDPSWHLRDPMRRVRFEREAAALDLQRAVAFRKSQRAARLEREAQSNEDSPDRALDGGARTQSSGAARAPIAAKVKAGQGGRAILRSPKPNPPPLTPVSISSRSGEQDTALVNLSEQSLAQNPDFEVDATAFEQKLGQMAFGHSAAHAAAQEMSHKAKAYMMDKAGGLWDAASKELQQMAKDIGSSNPGWSGSVGIAVKDVMAVFDRGNVAERMAHVSNFFVQIMGNDFLGGDRAAVQERMQKCRMDWGEAKDRFDSMRRNAESGRRPNPWEIAPVPEKVGKDRNPTVDQWHTRADRAEAHGIPQDAKQARSQMARGGRTLAQTGAQMSEREVALHQQAQPGWDPHKDPVRWEEGTRVWVMNERDKWVQKQRELSLPVGAGPSGSTNTLMQAASLFGTNAYNARAAAIAYLVPARHHTLVEILVGAAPFGCKYTPGRAMYKDILPFAEAELRACGKNGKFPHELHPDPAPSAGTSSESITRR